MARLEWTHRGLSLPVVLGLAAALVLLTALLCRRDRRLLSRRAGLVLTGLRCLVVLTVVSLLLDAAVELRRETRRKSQVLLLIDSSASMNRQDPFRLREQLINEARALGLPGGRPVGSGAAHGELRSWSRWALLDAFLHGLPPSTPGTEPLLHHLERRFEVEVAFLHEGAVRPGRIEAGRVVLPEPDGRWTDLGAPVVDSVSGRDRSHLGAVLLVSDGGHNVETSADSAMGLLRILGVPLYTLGVGAESRPADIALSDVNAPGTVFLDDPVTIDVAIDTVALPGRTLELELRRGSELVGGATIAIPTAGPEGARVSVPLELATGHGGRWKYTVSFPGQADEATPENNSRSFWVEVLEERVAVAYLEGPPRWSYHYLKDALEHDSALEATCHLVGTMPEARLPPGAPRERQAVFALDVLVLGDVDHRLFTSEELETLRDFVRLRGGFLVLLAGERAMPYAYGQTALNEVLPVSLLPLGVAPPPSPPGTRRKSLRLTREGELSPALRLDPDRERNLELWSALPPPTWICRHAGARDGSEVLAVWHDPGLASSTKGSSGVASGATAPQGQRAGPPGSRPSSDPAVFVTRRVGAGRVFFSAIDETWRWRWRVGEQYFNDFWTGVIRWGATERLGPSDGAVRLGSDGLRHEIPSRIHIRALVTGEYGEPTDGVDARVDAELTAETPGGARRYRMSQVPGSGGLFEVSIATGHGPDELPPGEYRVRLRIAGLSGYDERADRAALTLVVEDPVSRESETVARRADWLAALCATGAPGGRYSPIERWRDLLAELPSTTRTVEETKRLDQWSLAWPLILLVTTFLGIEWVVRRRFDLA